MTFFNDKEEIFETETFDQEDEQQAYILRAFLGTVKHFFGGFKKLFQDVDDPRNPKSSLYPLGGLLFIGVMMFACHLKSRRQINSILRGNKRSVDKFMELFGIDEIPHGDTLNHAFKKLEVAQLQEVVCHMVETLIRKKMLYPWRLMGRFYTVVVDGTGVLTFRERHCEHCLTKKLRNGKTLYYHPVLEAKLVTSNGFAFSLMTEFIENIDPEASKQDCELKAFYRLAERLKKRFPRLPICLLLDGLYAGGPTFSICKNYGWKYFIVLTDDDLPTVNRKLEALYQKTPENQLHILFDEDKEIEQDYRWIDEIDYIDSDNQHHTLAVLECIETKPDAKGQKQSTKFKWLTNFEMNSGTVNDLANNGGRLRWKIENEGFNVQKNGGFELEHAYSEDETAGKIFYLLLQIAHIIIQLMAKGSLFVKAFPNGVGSLKNMSFRLLEAWRNLRLSTKGLCSLFGGKFQIRFDSS